MRSASSATGWRAPVDVSACTTATRVVSGWRSSSSMMRSLGTTWPSSTATSTTFAPWRLAISTMRAPKKPATPMMTVSPGSVSEAMPASMPEVPLAESESVRPSSRR